MIRFKLYDGDSGTAYTVTEWIDDGKQDIKTDQDELDLIRFEGEGGAPPREIGKKRDEDTRDKKHFEGFKKKYQRKERKRKRKNYIMFGAKI